MEGKQEDDDELLPNGWQQVHSPHQPQPQSQPHNREREMVEDNTTDFNEDDLSIFPPSNHEGLHIPHDEPLSAQATLDDVVDADHHDAHVARGVEELHPVREQLDYRPGGVGVAVREKLKLGLGIFTSKIGTLLVRYGYGRGRVNLSFGQVAGVTLAWVAALWYLKWQRWRRASSEEKIDGLLLLVRQQDEKISRLLDQVSRLNELLAYRRGISILHSAY